MNSLDHLLEKIKALSPNSQKQLSTFVNYLRWQEQQATARQHGAIWTFDFIEHFAAAEKQPRYNEQGAEIKIGPALAEGQERPAIYAHPPVQGRSIIEYYVPVPSGIDHLTLKLAIGIRDGSKLGGSNLVAFSVQMNGYRVWGTQTNAHRWQAYEIPLAPQAGDINQITFATEALGNHQWTWAAWGSPVLVGKIVEETNKERANDDSI